MSCVLVPIVRICCPGCAPMSSGPTIESLSELISSLSVEEHTRFKGFPAEKRFVLVEIINFCRHFDYHLVHFSYLQRNRSIAGGC